MSWCKGCYGRVSAKYYPMCKACRKEDRHLRQLSKQGELAGSKSIRLHLPGLSQAVSRFLREEEYA